MNKHAATPLPLSPEEKYQASQLLGRGLFSMLQMAREEEIRKNKALKDELFSEEDERVLKIPVPENILPSATPKLAADRDKASFKIKESPLGDMQGEFTEADYRLLDKLKRNIGTIAGAGIGGGMAGYPGLVAGGLLGSNVDSAEDAYKRLKLTEKLKKLDGGTDYTFEPEEGSGYIAHLKRNAGKYLGALGGVLLKKQMPQSRLRHLLPVAGLAAGVGADQYMRDLAFQNLVNNPETKHDILSAIEMQKLKEKRAEDPESGILAGAITNIANNPVRMLLGTQEGFRNAKKEFYFKQKQQIHDELMQAQKEYIDTLNHIRNKTAAAAETPNVDAFCNGIAHYTMFEKTAAPVEIEDEAISRLIGDTLGMAKKPFKPVIDTAATTLLGGAGGAAYLTYLLKKRMREKPEEYMDEHMPTKVELQPYK